MDEIDFGPEQVHLIPERCPRCRASIAVEEHTRTDMVHGAWTRRFGVEPPAEVLVRWLGWACVNDPGHYAVEVRP